ncbi:CvpA family protein [Lachnospiraceae bacterium ZAX-1]
MDIHMNGLFIAVVIILVAFAIFGYWKGFVRIAFSLVSTILMIGLVSALTPYISTFIQENTPIYQMVQEKCVGSIRLKANEQIQEKTNDEVPIEIAGIQLPDVFQKQLLEKTGQAADKMLSQSGIYNEIGNYIAGFIVDGISFFVAFIFISIVLRFLVNILNIVAKLPVINGLNRTLGLLAGILEGTIIVWLLFFVVAMSCTSVIGQQMIAYINENAFLRFLYAHNGVLSVIDYIFSW